MKSHEIKAIQSQLAKNKFEVSQLDEELEDLKFKRQSLLNSQNSMIEKLKNKENKAISISEHAILRYIERKYDAPIKEYEQEIKDSLGGCLVYGRKMKFPIGDGLYALIKNGIVTTIIKK